MFILFVQIFLHFKEIAQELLKVLSCLTVKEIFHSQCLHWIINFTKCVNFLLSMFYLFKVAPAGE